MGRIDCPCFLDGEQLFIKNMFKTPSDFFFYPIESLPDFEHALNGVSSDEQNVTALVERFYAERSIESPGIQPVDFAKTLFPTV